MAEASTTSIKEALAWPEELAEVGARAVHKLGETVIFEHRFFTTFKGAYFRMSRQNDTPVFVVSLMENELVLPFDGILQEFDIDPDSHDGHMLAMVAESLTYVSFLRCGDPLPAEIATGEASWDVPEKVRRRVFDRLTLRLVEWLVGQDEDIAAPKEFLDKADDPAVKENVNQALAEASEQLGFGHRGKKKVIALVETLAEEIAHIEALRQRFEGVQVMDEKIHKLLPRYGSEPAALEVMLPVERLIRTAIREYQGYLDRVDVESRDIIDVLADIDAEIEAIRVVRNDLYRRLMAWDEMFEAWARVKVRRSAKMEVLLRKTYRFLAPRFMHRDEWLLMSQLLADRIDSNDPRVTEMVWYMDDEDEE